MFNWQIRPATTDEKSRVRFRKEHEGAGNRGQTEAARMRNQRVDRILSLLDETDVVAIEVNGQNARAAVYEEQAKLVDNARRRRGVVLRTKAVDGATGTTLYIKRDKL